MTTIMEIIIGMLFFMFCAVSIVAVVSWVLLWGLNDIGSDISVEFTEDDDDELDSVV